MRLGPDPRFSVASVARLIAGHADVHLGVVAARLADVAGAADLAGVVIDPIAAGAAAVVDFARAESGVRFPPG